LKAIITFLGAINNNFFFLAKYRVTMKGKSGMEKQKKIEDVMELIEKFRKSRLRHNFLA